MTKRTKILSWTGIGLGFAMAMLGLYRMFMTDSPVGDRVHSPTRWCLKEHPAHIIIQSSRGWAYSPPRAL